MKELSTPDQARLVKLETKIKNTIGAFVACGTALAEILEAKLYRSKYKTFDEYCERRWGWKRAHAYRLIEAAKVTQELKNLSPVGDKIENEWQARALSEVPAEQRVEVLEAASKAGDITAPGITAAAEKILGEISKHECPTIELDRTGYPIPPKAMETWKRADETEEILFHISKARAAVRDLQDTSDILYAEVNMNSVYADLCNAYSSFKQAVPHAVCPACQGRTSDTCTLCSGRGMISKFRYETAVPQELKAMRDRKIKPPVSKAKNGKSPVTEAA